MLNLLKAGWSRNTDTAGTVGLTLKAYTNIRYCRPYIKHKVAAMQDWSDLKCVLH